MGSGGRAEVACAGQHDRRQQVEDLGRRGPVAGRVAGRSARPPAGATVPPRAAIKASGPDQAGAVGAKGGVAHGP